MVLAESAPEDNPKSMSDLVLHRLDPGPPCGSSNDNDAWKSMCEMIEEHGFPCESHFVTTRDGYTLQIFRIPRPDAPSVLLQHGLESSSFQWIVQQPEKNQAITLAQAGFDVWMGNNRGNSFSANHTELDPWNRFWDVDFEDFGLQDIPAMADWITRVTGNQRISYVGHSQGTTQFVVGAALDPDYYEAKFDLMVALAPIARLTHHQSIPFALLAPQWKVLQDIIVHELGIYDWIHPYTWESMVLESVCGTLPVVQHWCELLLELISDSNVEVDDFDRMETYLTHVPGGAPYKSIVHYAQIIDSGKFQRFDCGTEAANKAKYGSSTPPEYPLDQIPTSIPIAMFAGRLDLLGNPTDVHWLKRQLGDRVVFFKEYELGHLSFSVAKDMSYWTRDAMKLLKEYAAVGPSSSSLRTTS